MKETYSIKVAGVERELPIIKKLVIVFVLQVL